MSAVSSDLREKKGLLKYLLLGSAAAMLPMGAAQAQEAASEDAAENDDNVIIVTATKREQSLQDIPLSVTAVSADALDNAAVTNLESLQFSVPGLVITTAAGSGFQSSLRIRGVGTSGTNLGFEGSVGIFVDGVFRPRAGTSLGDFADVERIEVLRGAQGTLFGRNTTAGAISVVTKKPVLNEFEGEVRATFGNLERRQIRGIVNVPLVDDKLAVRLSADYNKRDGFIENLIPGVGDLNDRDRINLRGQLLFQPTPETELRIIGTYFSADESCCGSTTFNNGFLVAGGNAGAFMPLGITPPVQTDESQFGDFLTARNSPTFENQEEYGVQVDFTWELSDSVTWFTQLSYSDYDFDAVTDSDQTSINAFIQDPSIVTQEQFTFETRFSGELNDLSFVESINWIFGGYYSDETLGQDIRLQFEDGAAALTAIIAGIPGSGFGPDGVFPGFGFGFNPGDFQDSVLGQEAQVYSVFGHLDIDVTDRFNIAGGLRYTEEDKTGTGDFTTFNGPLANPFILPGATPFEADQDASEFTGNIALTYEVIDDVSIYGSFARGYKSGGINLDTLGGQGGADFGSTRAFVGNMFGGPDAIIADPTFPEETVQSFEIGLKSQFWDRRATLNIAGFHSTFDNFQLLQFTGVSFNILAAPEVTTRGVEGELILNPVEGLNISAQYTYADAFYSADVPELGFVDGQRINNAPEHSGSINATYSTPIGSRHKAFVNGGWFFSSSFNASAGLEPTRIQESFSLFNGRIGVSTEDDSFGVELWCRNCFNEAVAQIIFSSPIGDNTEFAFIQPPREWGLTLSTRF